MTKRLSTEEIEVIRERVEKATEGPWRIGKQSPNGLNNIGTMGGLLTAQTLDENDATFIAHAREDIPKLLAEIDRLDARLQHAKELIALDTELIDKQSEEIDRLRNGIDEAIYDFSNEDYTDPNVVERIVDGLRELIYGGDNE